MMLTGFFSYQYLYPFCESEQNPSSSIDPVSYVYVGEGYRS